MTREHLKMWRGQRKAEEKLDGLTHELRTGQAPFTMEN